MDEARTPGKSEWTAAASSEEEADSTTAASKLCCSTLRRFELGVTVCVGVECELGQRSGLEERVHTLEVNVRGPLSANVRRRALPALMQLGRVSRPL